VRSAISHHSSISPKCLPHPRSLLLDRTSADKVARQTAIPSPTCPCSQPLSLTIPTKYTANPCNQSTTPRQNACAFLPDPGSRTLDAKQACFWACGAGHSLVALLHLALSGTSFGLGLRAFRLSSGDCLSRIVNCGANIYHSPPISLAVAGLPQRDNDGCSFCSTIYSILLRPHILLLQHRVLIIH
jgi:hypothetical protein